MDKFRIFNADEHRLECGLYESVEAAEKSIFDRNHLSTDYYVVFKEVKVWTGDKLLNLLGS